MLSILVADDEREVLRALSAVFELVGWNVTWASDGREALRRLRTEALDVAVLDLAMPGASGLEVLWTCAVEGITIPIVVISGAGDGAVGAEAMELGARKYIQKPWDPAALVAVIRDLAQAPPPPLARRLDARLRELAGDPALSRESFASAVGLSAGYVTRVLSKAFAMPFEKRLLWYRVELAKIRIATKGLQGTPG